MTTSDSTPATGFAPCRFTADNIAVSRGGRRVVENISIALEPGDVVVLRGPNGAGKTTLLRAFSGFLKCDSGACQIHSEGVENTGLVSQCAVYCGADNAIKTALTVSENLEFWAALYGAPSIRIASALASFALDEYALRPAAALSTGYRRRLGLSRLVIAGKPIWFVDEPTASLDTFASETFARLVDRHRASGGCAIIATHDALDISDVRNVALSVKGEAA